MDGSLDTTPYTLQGQAGLGDVAEFYDGRHIFITGATGCMGKVLVEKLLRSCPGLGNIYLLMRPKRGRPVQERLKDMVDSRLFDTLRQSSPSSLLRLKAVEGDILLPELGLSPEDSDMLAREVSIVIHAAATVKFDEALRLSLQMNVLGVVKMVKLCQRMEKLASFVHVSTAYCNCDRDEVEEMLYPAPSDPYKLLGLLDVLDEDMFNALTTKLIGNRPNTYTFTKALAEQILVTEGKGLPISIVRPSIVAAAWREPIPGWVDNLNGPTGIIVGTAKGVMRTIYCNEDLVADLIPVDIPINLIIAVACHTARRKGPDLEIFNCVSGGMETPVRWRDIRTYGLRAARGAAVMEGVMWYPDLTLTSDRRLNSLLVRVHHRLPAFVLDLVSRALGRRPTMSRIVEKMDKAAACLEYFTTNEWRFLNSNVCALWSNLSKQDQQTFNFDLSTLDWETYMESYCLGARKHVLKEDESTLPQSRAYLKKMMYLHYGCRALLGVAAVALPYLAYVFAGSQEQQDQTCSAAL